MLNPNDFVKFGTWTDGTYFNALGWQSQNKQTYQKALGIDYELKKSLEIGGDFFWPKDKYKQYLSLVREDPFAFVTMWNKNCLRAIKDLKEYVDEQKGRPYQKYTSQQLLKVLDEFEELLKPLGVFVWSYLYTADVYEKFIIEKIPSIDFSEIRPLYKISAERLNDELLGEGSLEEIKVKWAWYGLNLLRADPLSIEDLKKIKQVATKTKEITQNNDPLIKEMQLFMWLKFERIDIFNYAYYWMRPFIKQILQKVNLDIKYWDILLSHELRKIVMAKEVPEDLESRFTYRGTIMVDGNVQHVTKDEFIQYQKLFNPSVKKVEEVQGKIACKGLVQGRVKVVRDPAEITKVEEGDILVATETIVQHEPYMHKTKGMVIEMASLLCHSAIFAREFQIPCVVGVENATKIFKDGDIVEVNAEKGVITLKRQKDL